MKNPVKATLSLLLAASFLVQLVPVQAVFATNQEPNWSDLRTEAILDRNPVETLLTEQDFPGFAQDSPDGEGAEETLIVEEMEELREENTKHFRYEDGTFTAVLYSDLAHYQDDAGEWQEIDNTLTLEYDDEGNPVFAPEASGLDISIPQGFDDGQKLIVAKDGHVVSLGISELNEDALLKESRAEVVEVNDLGSERLKANADALKEEMKAEKAEKKAERKAALEAEKAAKKTGLPEAPAGLEVDLPKEPAVLPETDISLEAEESQTVQIAEHVLERLNQPIEEEPAKEPETVQEQNKQVMELENQSSALVYPDIFPGADLEYMVTPSMIKENIIVKALLEEYSYKFDLALDGFLPVPQDDGSICLFENADDKDPVLILQAPYMFDAVGEESNAVSMTLSEDGVLTLTADAAWVNDEERELPVVIDPTLILSTSAIQDIYVNESNTGGGNNNYNYAGKATSGGIHRTYIKFTLPTLPSGSVVANAVLGVWQNDTVSFTNGMYLSAYICPGPWNIQGNGTLFNYYKWSPQPISTAPNGAVASGAIQLDYEPVLQGSMLGSSIPYAFNITKAVRSWYDKGNNNGIILTSSNETVNTRSDLYSTGNSATSARPAVVIQYTVPLGLENSWTYETVDLGRSGIAYVNSFNGELTYVHNNINMNGNRLPIQLSHVFNNTSKNAAAVVSASGNAYGANFKLNLEEWIETVSGHYETELYLLYDGDGTPHHFSINKDKSNAITNELDSTQVLTKTTSGYIITDAQGTKKHYTTLGSTTLLGRKTLLTKIEDANGAVQTITWEQLLTGLPGIWAIKQVTDPAGRVVTFTNNATTKTLTSFKDPAGRTTKFAYTDGRLTKITYPDSKFTEFEYNTANRLTRVISHDKSVLTFTYSGARVAAMSIFPKESGGTGTATNKWTFKYDNGVNRVTDRFSNYNEYLFDAMGHVTNTSNQDGQVSFALYDGNSVAQTSMTQTVATNLLVNSGFEASGTWTRQYLTGLNYGSAGFSTAEAKNGTRSMLVQCATTVAGVHNASRQVVQAKPGTTYTLSADMFIPSDLSQGNAWIGFEYQNASGDWVMNRGNLITSTNGWQRHSATFTLPATASAELRVLMGLDSSDGKVYFDNAQLEEGGGSQYYNHVQNSNFAAAPGANNTPTGAKATSWTMAGNETGDGVQVQNGRNWMYLTGSPAKNKTVGQTVTLNAKAGETLIIGGVAAFTGCPDREDTRRKFSIVAEVFDTAGKSIKLLEQSFRTDITDHHQTMAFSYTLPKDISKVNYFFTYANQVGNVSFDDAFVYVGNFGTQYQYENDKMTTIKSDNGNEIRMTYNENGDVAKMSEFEGDQSQGAMIMTYSGRRIATVTNKDNVKTTYTYHKTHYQPTNVSTTKDGVTLSESMTYTDCGNYLLTHTNERGKKTEYTYDTVKGLLLSEKDPNGNIKTYTYNNNTDELLSVTSGGMTTSFTTQDDLPATIKRNGTTYAYEYNSQNLVTAAKVDTTALVTNTYDTRQRLTKQTYADGTYYTPTYDSRNRVTSEKWGPAKSQITPITRSTNSRR